MRRAALHIHRVVTLPGGIASELYTKDGADCDRELAGKIGSALNCCMNVNVHAVSKKKNCGPPQAGGIRKRYTPC